MSASLIGTLQNLVGQSFVLASQVAAPIVATLALVTLLVGCVNRSLPQFALAWILREANVASAIIGASRPEQVIDNAGVAGTAVCPEMFVRAEALIAKAGKAR